MCTHRARHPKRCSRTLEVIHSPNYQIVLRCGPRYGVWGRRKGASYQYNKLPQRKGVKEMPAVSEVMVSDVSTIDSSVSIGDADKRMAEHELDRILIVEGDQLVGFLSEADIHSAEGPLG
jgi:CBS domain-containing protein